MTLSAMGRSNNIDKQIKRLCLVITTPSNRKGTGYYTLKIAQSAASAGYQVDIITGWGLIYEQAQELIQDVNLPPEIRYVRLPCLTKYINPIQDLKTLISLFSLFRKGKYDIVHTSLAKAGILGRIAAGLARIPCVVHTVYGPSFWPTQHFLRRSLYIFLEKLAGFFTTHYIFISNQLRKQFAAHGIGKKADKRVIYAPLNLPPFRAAGRGTIEEKNLWRAQWGLRSDDLLVGFIARMVPSKGHEMAIRACHALISRFPNLKLVLVGGARWPDEIKYFQKLQSLVLELSMADRVIFTGHQNSVIPFYQMFDIYLCPSLYEGVVSATIMEAFLVGLPVIAFDLPGSREEGLDQGAVFVPCYDLAALTSALAETIDNLPNFIPDTPSRREQAKKLVAQWSMEDWTKNLILFYRELSAKPLGTYQMIQGVE